METTVLTDDVIKSANPGMTDFGSGLLIVVSSQCLRCTKKTLDCTICSDFCPVGGIDTTYDGRPNITNSCIKCGACTAVCPSNALAVATKPARQISRWLLQATLRSEQMVIACERTTALLRLAVRTDEADAAIAGLKIVKDARQKEQLIFLPCLAMMTKELWFSVLNEIDVSKVKDLSVLLPIGQCEQCPVNAKENIEELFSEAISMAEQWAGIEVGIITELADVPKKRVANVRQFLVSDEVVDRRGLFTGFVGELKQSWDDNAQVGNRALEESQIQRARRDSFERTRLAADQKKKIATSVRPIETPFRYLLVEALGRNDAHADSVSILVTDTDQDLCNFCGSCVDVCPVRARKKVDDKVVVDDLYCVGCSACLQVCPTEACYFAEVSGRAYLVEEDPEGEAETDDSE